MSRRRGGWQAGGGLHAPLTCDPLTTPPRLETLSMQLTALLVRVLVHLGLLPEAQGLYEYLET